MLNRKVTQEDRRKIMTKWRMKITEKVRKGRTTEKTPTWITKKRKLQEKIENPNNLFSLIIVSRIIFAKPFK